MQGTASPPQRQSLRFCKAFFEVIDGPAARARLVDAGALELLGGAGDTRDHWFRWDLPADQDDQPGLSFLVRFSRDRLVLEGPTAAAVGRGWRALDEILDPHARARVAAGDDLGRFLPRKRKHSADRPDSWSREHEAQVLREFYGELCRRWAHQPHPRLDGMSPFNAALDPAMRDRLDELLDRMSRIEEQRRERGIPGISVDDLRASLDPAGSS